MVAGVGLLTTTAFGWLFSADLGWSIFWGGVLMGWLEAWFWVSEDLDGESEFLFWELLIVA